MLFPTVTCVDNFFDDPDAVVEKSKQFEYKVNNVSAGSRSIPLHAIDYEFFNWVNSKIVTIFYPNFSQNLSFHASTHFDKVKKSDHDNWVHCDSDTKFAAIIFLNKEGTAGTSIYKKKGFHHNIIQKSTGYKYKYFEKGHQMNKKELNNDSMYGGVATSGMRKVASIPLIVIEKWKRELGIDIMDKNDMPKIKKLLNDPEYRWLRTHESNL